jgi:hypothetical protein
MSVFTLGVRGDNHPRATGAVPMDPTMYLNPAAVLRFMPYIECEIWGTSATF